MRQSAGPQNANPRQHCQMTQLGQFIISGSLGYPGCQFGKLHKHGRSSRPFKFMQPKNVFGFKIFFCKTRQGSQTKLMLVTTCGMLGVQYRDWLSCRDQLYKVTPRAHDRPIARPPTSSPTSCKNVSKGFQL
jgi:hypothetical protein